MSIEAKQLLIREIEGTLSDKLTADTLRTVMAEIETGMMEYTVDRDPTYWKQNAFDELLETFLEAKKIEGRSEKTVERYKYILGRLRDETGIPIDRMTVFTMRSWLSKEQARGIGDKTLEGYRCVFSSFFGWLHKEGLLPGNPCANMPHQV